MLRSSDIPLHYVACDIPDGMTLTDWRRDRLAAERRSAEAAHEARARARSAAIRRRLPRLPRLRPAPAPSFRPRFA